MSEDYKNKERKNVLDHIAALRAGETQPSKVRLEQARYMAKYYNHWKTGEKGPFSRMNDNATVALAQQLEAMAAETLMAPTEPLVARQILSNAQDVLPGHDTYSYAIADRQGKAKPIANYADDPQMVNFSREKVTHRILDYGAGFHWTVQDIERAAFMPGFNLPAMGPMEARKAFDEGVDQVLSLGEPDYGISYGLANQPVGTGASQVRNTAMTSADWTAGTLDGDGMYQDLAKLVAEFERDNLNVFPATHLLLPPGAYANARQTRLSDDGLTVLAAFRLANPGIEVLPWSKLVNVDSANDNNDSRALVLNNGPTVAQNIMAKEFTLLPPQPVNFAFKVVGLGSCGGVAVRTKIAMRYGTKLPTAG
jgi:hypothetical protein